MRDIIKKVLREALGVPEGIVSASRKLYDEFTSYFFNAITQGVNEYDFYVTPNNPMNIGGLVIDEVNFVVTIHENKRADEVDVVSMGVGGKVEVENDPKPIMKVKDKGGVVLFQMDIVVPEDWKESDVIDYFNKNRPKIISSFTHEMKHEFDDFKKPFMSVKDRLDYEMAKEMMQGVNSLRKFAFLMYFTHRIENLVRPSELASLIDTEQITKKEFVDFVKNNNTYKMLDDARNLSLESMKSEMLGEVGRIKKLFDNNDIDYDGMSDEEIVDEMLDIFYITMSNQKMNRFLDIMSDNIFERLIGFSGSKLKNVEKYQNYVSKFESNPKEFYNYEFGKMKNVSDKMIRKLYKLYDLAK